MDFMKILEQELGRTCAPDLKHQKQLSFEFSYDEKIGEEIEERKKKVVCHPHFKLIRDDSNLRVYFQWKDDIRIDRMGMPAKLYT